MKRLLIASFILAILILQPSISYAKTWYIKPDGSGDAPTIQAGIDSAAVADTVLLANGTYTADGNRDIDYKGKAITVRSESGNPNTCIIDCQGSPTDSHRGFYFHSLEGPSSILNGVTIKNGDYSMGGGVLCESHSSPTFSNCIFLDNSAHDGGGMYCINYSSPTLTNCTFSGNSTVPSTFYGQGGGMFFTYYSSPTLTGCTFSGNSAHRNGGGICAQSGFPTIIDCTFSANSARNGGGMSSGTCSPTLTNCKFLGNSVTEQGGGLEFYISNGTLTNCKISENSKSAVYCYQSSPTLTSCTIVSNEAEAVWCYYNSSPTLDNTIIAFNRVGLGAVYCLLTGNAPTLTCCDVYNNGGGDWIECIANQAGINGNFSADPEFCGELGSGNYFLQSDSPCAPGNHPNQVDCGLIGALPVGCESTPTEQKTWGEIKALYFK